MKFIQLNIHCDTKAAGLQKKECQSFHFCYASGNFALGFRVT